MKVSVILPVYNGESTLADTLESLAKQNYTEFELLACIDGTYDGSRDILEAYRARFSALRIIQNEKNLGLGPTMNRLVYEANGSYLAVAEQDDYYYPYRLDEQVKVLDQWPEVGLVSGIAEFWDGEKITMRFPGILTNGHQYPVGYEMFNYLYVNQTKVVNSCMMFRKEVHISNGLYFSQHYPSIPVDWAYFLRFSLVSRIYGLHEILVRLDRRQSRHSVTMNNVLRFKANRELLRSFKFEFPLLIDKTLYRDAKNVQSNLELRSKYGSDFVLGILTNLIKDPLNFFPIDLALERVKRKLR